MNRLFEPVYFDQNFLFWDYGIRIENNFKGYYHWHQCCEFLLVHQGQGTVVVNQHTFEIKRGMFFFFQPYQLHQVYADVSPEHPYVRSIFYADPLLIENQLRSFPSRHSRFEALWRSPNRANAYDLGHDVERMEWIFEQYEHAKRRGMREDIEELTLLFLQMINILPESDSNGSRKEIELKAKRALRYSETVMRWIEEHYHEEVSLEQLAEEIHLSPNYISRLFRQETGSNITDYLTARRIKQACRLLETTHLPVEQVGNEAGFGNVSYFIQLFKKVVGTTPLKYRHSKIQMHQDK
ncbi:AraC family transcriptional regulator [Paenibacillus sedimenti]|uniref:Helix-turn-helix transcriptional regulator n=1 Tax=Paenibacillus sedimenti TaxID=2770274 RepID=A0A926QK89_9BACL|nr:AraC family transcriptional regulator [Paenibacillus sedimenti]MBD0381493.1 helix-turn-helix transcriptional regulator [Paenibacillus sedimenti]